MSPDFFQRIDELVRIIEAAPDTRIRAAALELMQSVLHLHGEALQRILALCRSHSGFGQQIVSEMSQDALIAGILALHGCHPDALADRVRAALDRMQPTLSARGARVEFIRMDADGVVRLEVHQTVPNTSGLQALIEDRLLSAAPEIANVVIEGMPERRPDGFVPIAALTKNSAV
jgi:Fe-S cluster biogenesis protein NfuA